MTKRKISGQTVTIIILVILLILTAAFGGVYAYYSTKSNRVSGRITLTALSINFDALEHDPGSGKTQMYLTNSTLVVPNEPLGNEDALVIINNSPEDVPIYVAVVYTIGIKKVKITGPNTFDYDNDADPVYDDFECPFLDFGEEYTRKNGEVLNEGSQYVYYHFTAPAVAGEPAKQFHCILTKMPTSERDLTIVGKQDLRLHRDLTGGENNKYMSTAISFTMQAFAIGSNTWNYTTAKGHEEEIMTAIYETNGADIDMLDRISKEVVNAG